MRASILSRVGQSEGCSRWQEHGFAGINHLLPVLVCRVSDFRIYIPFTNESHLCATRARRSHAQISCRQWQSQEPAGDLNFALGVITVQTDPRVDAVDSIRGRREWAQRFATA